MAKRSNNSALKRITQAGLRPTTARVAILESLMAVPDHPTADELAARLARRGHVIGRATVYQNLDRLAEAGVINSITVSDGLRRFDATLEPHQHLVCARTSRVFDVQVDAALLRRLKPLDPATGKPINDRRVTDIRVLFVSEN